MAGIRHRGVLIVAITFCAYSLAYFALLTPNTMSPLGHASDGSQICLRTAQYRCDHSAIQNAFAPLLWLDMKCRPTYWHWVEIPDPPLRFHPAVTWEGGFLIPGRNNADHDRSRDIGFGGSPQRGPTEYKRVDPVTKLPLRNQRYWQWRPIVLQRESHHCVARLWSDNQVGEARWWAAFYSSRHQRPQPADFQRFSCQQGRTEWSASI